MAETTVIETNPSNQLDPQSSTSIISRRIMFVPVKKPFKGFSNDFHIETLNPSEPGPSGSAAAPATPKKHDASEFSEYGFDPELSLGITVRRIGAGLQNLGNTCFLNSVLQCLTYTEPLAAYLQSGKHKTSCNVAGFCALCAIQNHVSRALQATGRILSPNDLVGNLRCISRNFRNARQEDAHEYMVNLLECMHKCCLPCGVPSESPGAYEKSFVHKIFGGRLRSQVECFQCSYRSNKFDPFLDLSLEIFRADSLHRALSNFTAAEWLDGGEKEYLCQQCKHKVRARKWLTIHKAPYVLTIHLKRFHAHDPGQKINKKVQFGRSLDLRPFVSGSYEGDLRYSLYGVLVHSGSSTHSGHYYCYVRTSNNMWYTLDDKRVSNVSEREVLSQQAYMLFYVRDRKNMIPRKPVDIANKENVKTNVNGNRESLTSSHVLKEYPNGPAENKYFSEPSLTAEAEKMSNVVEVSNVEKMSSLDHSGRDASLPNNLKCFAASVGEKVNFCNENAKEGITNSPSIVPSSINPETCEVTTDTGGKSESLQLGTSATGSECDKTGSVGHEDPVGSPGLVLNVPVNKSLNTVCVHQKNVKKQKKKFLKYQVSMMHFRPIYRYMAYLGPRKKDHKRVKCLSLVLKNPNKEKLDKFPFSSEDAQPSKGFASATHVENISGGGSVVSHFEARQAEIAQESRRNQMHNGLMSMLTRGLEETVVARWDDIGLPSSRSLESQNDKVGSIGYVGDEWDEEYDKGKRKKIRGFKHSFGGPNLFQEIAFEKSKFKRAKLDQSCSGNPPFRI